MMLSSSLPVGGRERQVVSLIKAIHENPDIEIVLVLLLKNVFYTEIYEFPITIEIVNAKSTKDYRILSAFSNIFKKHNPDVIHAWDEYVAFYALPIANILKIKFINGSLLHGIFQFRLRQIVRNITYRFSPYIIANSHAGYKANRLKEKASRFVIYNGIDEKFDKNNFPDVSILSCL